MASPVIAIGIDAMSPELMERWAAQGRLPTIARLMREGTYARQANFGLYRVENSWLTLLHGCSPHTGNEWGHQQYVGGYEMRERAAYTFTTYPPFYALVPGKRVAVFDIPLTRQVEGVDGAQLLGWGTEVNQILRQSSPPGLMKELIARHGRHPLYDTITNADDGSETLSYRIPSVYDAARMREVRDMLVTAAHQRSRIILELMARERWDMLMAVYAEAHTGGHLLWHLSQPHALGTAMRKEEGTDYLLDVAQAIDSGLAQIEANLPDAAQLVVFSPHGMQGNTLDTYSMLMLPEMLYRWNTGKAALAAGDTSSPPGSPPTGFSRHWREEVWDMRTPHGDEVLESPYEQQARRDPLDWDPGNWFRKCWPTMRAFALPGYSEGLIRINIAGRDGPAGIPAERFGATCDEIEALVRSLRDARGGEPLVRDVIRVRKEAGDHHHSPADLMVLWRDDVVADSVEHPALGRVGPVPYFRTGGHSTEGFVLAKGPAFPRNCRLETVSTPDVTATLLASMGAALPDHVEGKPIGGAS